MGAKQKRSRWFSNGFRCFMLVFLFVVSFCGFVNAAEKRTNAKAKKQFEEEGVLNPKVGQLKPFVPHFNIDLDVDDLMNAYASTLSEEAFPELESLSMRMPQSNYDSLPSNPFGLWQDHINPNEDSSQEEDDDSNHNPAGSAAIVLANIGGGGYGGLRSGHDQPLNASLPGPPELPTVPSVSAQIIGNDGLLFHNMDRFEVPIAEEKIEPPTLEPPKIDPPKVDPPKMELSPPNYEKEVKDDKEEAKKQ